jgi:hypothetical protein
LAPGPGRHAEVAVFDGKDWTQHHHPLPPPPELDPDLSTVAESLLQLVIDSYNHAYSTAVAAGELPNTTDVANGLLNAITQHYKDDTDTQKIVLAIYAGQGSREATS